METLGLSERSDVALRSPLRPTVAGLLADVPLLRIADHLAATEYLDDMNRHGFDGIGGCIYLAVRAIETPSLAGVAHYSSNFGREVVTGLRDNGGPTCAAVDVPELAVCGWLRRRRDVRDAWGRLPFCGILIVEHPNRRDRKVVQDGVPVIEGDGYLVALKDV